MKTKHFTLKLSVLFSLFLLIFAATAQPVAAFTETNSNTTQSNVSVSIKQIKELANFQFTGNSTPSQALASVVAGLVTADETGTTGAQNNLTLSATDVLKYCYPNYSAAQLQGATITPDQAVVWLHSVGYSATIVNRPLTTAEIKSYLDQSSPIVPILANQNADDWLVQNYAGILYAHDDVTAGTQQLHKSFIKSPNFGEAQIQDGTEAQAFTFASMTNSPDPMEQADTFMWVSTITGIKKDPSWSNAQTIVGNKASGIFASKLTNVSGQSELDFTDPAVTALWTKTPQTDTADQTTKLAAVSLINLYETAASQKTVADLDNYLKISATTYVTTAQIESWYQYLGFDFDVVKGKAPMALTQAVNKSGRLYLTVMDATSATNPVKNDAAIGIGYLNNSFDGYQPEWATTKMGDDLIPYYNTPLTAAGMTQYQKLAATFSYSSIVGMVWPSLAKPTYAEDATLYNIRAKGQPDGTEVSAAPTSSVTTTTPTSTVKASTNATYIAAPNFEIRETQGQQPWCSEYVQAAAINTVDKTAAFNSPITAQAIMQGLFPTLSASALANTGGPSIYTNLKYFQTKYQVTADIVNQPLTFAQVKQQIDSDEVVEMDMYDINNPAALGQRIILDIQLLLLVILHLQVGQPHLIMKCGIHGTTRLSMSHQLHQQSILQE
jgi:hypothetical protein